MVLAKMGFSDRKIEEKMGVSYGEVEHFLAERLMLKASWLYGRRKKTGSDWIPVAWRLGVEEDMDDLD